MSYKGNGLTMRITATAPNVTGSFRRRYTSADIPAIVRVPVPAGTTFSVSNFSISAPSSSGSVSLSVDVTLPSVPGSTAVQHFIEVSHLAEPNTPWWNTDILGSWFVQNDWIRHTYYAISPGTRAVPGTVCPSGVIGCLTVNGLPAGSGNANDKRVVLALMGRPLPGQATTTLEPATHALPSPATYTGVPGAFAVASRLVTNDVLAVCPFQYTPQSGSALVPCN